MTIVQKYGKILIMKIAHAGPDFQITTDSAVIALGHSERKEVGQYWGEVLGELGVFNRVEIVTTNMLDSKLGRKAIESLFEPSTAFSHSAGVIRVPNAAQLVAHNPVEPLPIVEALIRADMVTRDKIEKEVGAHKTGLSDLAKAGLELIGSPVTTVDTILRLDRGYSATRDLIQRQDRGEFQEGIAMIHSLEDVFGFPDVSKINEASSSGITSVLIPEHKHAEVLFAPRRTVELLTPVIFPEQG